MLTEGGVKAARSRVQQTLRKRQIYESHYGGAPLVMMRSWRAPWMTLFMGDEDWGDQILAVVDSVKREIRFYARGWS